MSKIPKIIHQVFFSTQAVIPEHYCRYSQTVKEHHRHWEYVVWDETKSRKFIEENYSWFLSVFDSYRYPIQRIDSIRYFILYHYGGFYMDMDIECLKPIDDLLEDFELVLSQAFNSYSNTVIGSVPGYPLWLEVFELLKKRQDSSVLSSRFFLKNSMPYYINYSTGPILLSDCVVKGRFSERPEVRICPGYIFEPDTPREINGKFLKLEDKTESYTIHHMTTHWLPWYEKILSQIFKVLVKPYWSLRSWKYLNK
ncbi:MAG: glycosyltransferase [Scytonema sp. PMC 1069.18]|nr:glycosyltransferase [Scytonema sp. PMC 1069.18]MEC4883848.1 glycosyltransferase [Scytonema sp. PMC 1070.18]